MCASSNIDSQNTIKAHTCPYPEVSQSFPSVPESIAWSIHRRILSIIQEYLYHRICILGSILQAVKSGSSLDSIWNILEKVVAVLNTP